jgi:bifunctional non-homologous end joining protein LigD
MRLSHRSRPFDSEDWIFELKIDGWRALAVVENGVCTLISRNGNTFKRFEDLRTDLAKRLPDGTVLDGEICCLDDSGRPQFYGLMRRDPDCHFYAFDALTIAATTFARFHCSRGNSVCES